jgi:hypothetical protein
LTNVTFNHTEERLERRAMAGNDGDDDANTGFIGVHGELTVSVERYGDVKKYRGGSEPGQKDPDFAPIRLSDDGSEGESEDEVTVVKRKPGGWKSAVLSEEYWPEAGDCVTFVACGSNFDCKRCVFFPPRCCVSMWPASPFMFSCS